MKMLRNAMFLNFAFSKSIFTRQYMRVAVRPCVKTWFGN